MTITVEKYIGGKRYIEGAYHSTEDKPTDNIAAGSIMVETDSGDVYFYDGTTEAYVKQFSFQD